jgi:hypothetical protein
VVGLGVFVLWEEGEVETVGGDGKEGSYRGLGFGEVY